MADAQVSVLASPRGDVDRFLSAPEDHQRQAREVASRATAMGTPPPSVLSQAGRLNEDTLPDPQRRYSKAQAQFTQHQHDRSPAAMLAMSPGRTTGSSPLNNYYMQSPATPFDIGLGMNGIAKMNDPMSANRVLHEHLRVDVAPAGHAPGADLPPPSAASSTKRKVTAKKTGPRAGTKAAPKRKPNRLKRPTPSSGEFSTDQSPTPTHIHPVQDPVASPLSSSYQMTPVAKSAVSAGPMSAFPPLDSSAFELAQQGQQHGQVSWFQENVTYATSQATGLAHYEAQYVPQQQVQTAAQAEGEPSAAIQMRSSSDGQSSSEGPKAEDFFKAFEGFAGGDVPVGEPPESFGGFDFDVSATLILDMFCESC